MRPNFSLSKFVVFILFIAVSASCKKDKVVIAPARTDSVEVSGTRYATVKIGSLTWTTENFRGAGGMPYDAAGTKPEYGRYYGYQEIKAILVPAGWRIPTTKDFIKLGESQGIIFTDHLAVNQEASKKLISTTRWTNVKGNNESGFNGYPAGYVLNNGKPLDGDISEFWTSEGNTFSMMESADKNNLRLTFYSNSSEEVYKFNLRFVKDN